MTIVNGNAVVALMVLARRPSHTGALVFEYEYALRAPKRLWRVPVVGLAFGTHCCYGGAALELGRSERLRIFSLGESYI